MKGIVKDLDKITIEELILIDLQLLSDTEIIKIYSKVNNKVNKYASHLIRLLLECQQILVEKTLTFPLPQNNLVRDIKIGKYDLDFVLNKADELEKLIDIAYVKSDLQYSANKEEINKLQIRLIEKFWEKQ